VRGDGQTLAPLRGGVPAALRREIAAALRGESLAVVLYGSQARGTAGPDSDVDVLQLVEAGRESYRHGRVEVTRNTPEQLAEAAREGGLFVAHLLHDGRVVDDDDGVLAAALAQYRAPSSYQPYQDDLGAISALLHVVDPELDAAVARHGVAFGRLALFLLRGLATMATAGRGPMVSDPDRFAAVLDDPALDPAMALRREEDPLTRAQLDVLAAALRGYAPAPAPGTRVELAAVLADIRSRPRAAAITAAFLPSLLA
jgi:predicted nucleotidyltransferase